MDQQERVLGWWRAKHTPPPKRAARGPLQPRPGDTVTADGASFWGLGG